MIELVTSPKEVLESGAPGRLKSSPRTAARAVVAPPAAAPRSAHRAHRDEQRTLGFAAHPSSRASAGGAGDADHVIRTKRTPLGADVATRRVPALFRRARSAPRSQDHSRSGAARRLDPASARRGGKTAKNAAIVAEIYEHDRRHPPRQARWRIQACPRRTSRRQYRDRAGNSRKAARCLRRRDALVTGAASGSAAAVAAFRAARRWSARLMRRSDRHHRGDFSGVSCDVPTRDQVRSASKAVLAFTAIDMLVLNAGIFGEPQDRRFAHRRWRKAMNVNLTNLVLIAPATVSPERPRRRVGGHG
jgi:hypothetical protein